MKIKFGDHEFMAGGQRMKADKRIGSMSALLSAYPFLSVATGYYMAGGQRTENGLVDWFHGRVLLSAYPFLSVDRVSPLNFLKL